MTEKNKIIRDYSNLFGQSIYVIDGNIYEEVVDVIVQETNKHMLYNNNMDISTKGGEELKKECKE
jgi:O-acetyl-ADP-ribose deacetylase (regulator of RNase III)